MAAVKQRKQQVQQKKPVAAAAAAAAAAKKGRTVDRSNAYFRTINIIALFGVAFQYAHSKGPDDNVEKDGALFNKGPMYEFWLSEPVIYGFSAMYVLAVLLVSRFMSDKKPLTAFLKTYVQPVYNITQIVLCSYMAWGLMPTDITNPFGINTQRNKDIEYFVFIHYMSKYLDWCDTFFMILKKNYSQVSFLQVFHHATIGVVWGFLLNRGWGSGTASYGAFINSVTHVIMYTHYLWTSFGLKNPFKKYITTFQLTQFASCILHALIVLGYETVYPLDFSYLQLSYHAIMLLLFGQLMSWAPRYLTGEVDALDSKSA